MSTSICSSSLGNFSGNAMFQRWDHFIGWMSTASAGRHISGVVSAWIHWGCSDLSTGCTVNTILFRKVLLVASPPNPETAILTLLPSRPSSSITFCWTNDVWAPGSKKHLTTFEHPLDPHKIAGTVCRITFPTELTATEFAMTEDDTGGRDDEDGNSGTDSTLTSSKWGRAESWCRRLWCLPRQYLHGGFWHTSALWPDSRHRKHRPLEVAFLNLSFTGNDRKLTHDFKPWF